MDGSIDARETEKTRARYNRLAPFYDRMEHGAEQGFAPRRQRLWSLIPGGRLLEVGVGTGKNLPYHPAGADVTGIDLSDRMLEQARHKAQELGRSIDLREMDVQKLAFPDASFDAAAATFVFCSVPDSMSGSARVGTRGQTGRADHPAGACADRPAGHPGQVDGRPGPARREGDGSAYQPPYGRLRTAGGAGSRKGGGPGSPWPSEADCRTASRCSAGH